MKKLEEIIESIKDGSIFIINKYNCEQNESTYSSCILVYDGRIFIDVKTVEIRDLLKNIPNIKKQIDDGYTYQIKYNREQNVFENAIVLSKIEDEFEERTLYETVNNLLVNGTDFLDSIIELDTKISQYKPEKNKIMKKVVTA